MLRIEDSVIYQDIIEKGKKEGIEKGKREGMEKGKGQGKVEIVIRLLKRKFKNLPKSYEERLSEVKEDTIDKIAEDIFDIEDVKDLNKYLK